MIEGYLVVIGGLDGLSSLQGAVEYGDAEFYETEVGMRKAADWNRNLHKVDVLKVTLMEHHDRKLR